jgi:hypothetical protein
VHFTAAVVLAFTLVFRWRAGEAGVLSDGHVPFTSPGPSRPGRRTLNAAHFAATRLAIRMFYPCSTYCTQRCPGLRVQIKRPLREAGDSSANSAC